MPRMSPALQVIFLFVLLMFYVSVTAVPATALNSDSFALSACESELSFGGQSGHSHEGKCEGQSQQPPTSYYKDGSRTKQIGHGPKLKYRVEYYRQCEPALMLEMGCDANPDPPCADGSYPLIRMIFAVNGPRKGQLVGTSSYCSIEPALEIPGAEQDVAKVTPERFRELPILASSIVSQPEGFSLRNGHAHMYAESTTQDFSITIFDQDVRVRAIPVSYVWGYGDGTSRTFAFPGGPVAQRGFDEATSTSHVYSDTGNFGVGLTTRFRGEYSTEGGPWTPIPGVASVPSEQSAMSVWRTKKILVAENCNQGPSSPGCASLIDR